jgi:hypothetical protein
VLFDGTCRVDPGGPGLLGESSFRISRSSAPCAKFGWLILLVGFCLAWSSTDYINSTMSVRRFIFSSSSFEAIVGPVQIGLLFRFSKCNIY